MPKPEDNILEPLIESFTRMVELYGEGLDSAMAEVAIEILAMKDSFYGQELTFFEKGILMLTDCSDEMADDVKACMFWWVFNGELMDNEINRLIETKSKI